MTTSRLQWRCRRGTLELDEMLLRFLQRGWDALDEAGRQRFEALLEWDDEVLQAALLMGEMLVDAQDQALVDHIRDLAREGGVHEA